MVTARTRRIVFFFMAVVLFNYFYHLMGFSIISAETLKKIPFIPIRAELNRMEYSKYYSQFVDDYAGFMTIIMLLFVISTGLIVFIFFRRIAVIIGLVKHRELESYSMFVGVLILYVAATHFWVLEWNSVFFNENPKIGGNYYWFTTLILSLPWIGILPALVIISLEPEVFSYSLFKGPENNEPENQEK